MARSVPAAMVMVALVGAALAPGAAHAQDGAPPAAAPAPTPAKCTVTSPGADPVVERRYSPTVGDVVRFEFTVRNTQRMETPDNAVPEMAMPPIAFVSASTIQSFTDHTIAADLTFESVSVGDDPVLGPQLEQMVAPLVGKGGVMKISDRGEDLGFSLSVDAQALGPGAGMVAAVASSLRGVMTVLPPEAIGTGATWTSVEQQPDEQGILVTQTITHTLESVTDEGFVIAMVMKQEAPAQNLPAPPTMPGAALRLESLHGAGTAKVTGTFGSIMPTLVTLELQTTTEISYKQGDVEQRLIRTISTSADGKTLAPDEPAEAPSNDTPSDE